MSTLGQRLWALRRMRRISRNELARLSGTKPETLTRLCKDEPTRVSFAGMQKIASVLNCKIGWLVGEVQDPSLPEEDILKLAGKMPRAWTTGEQRKLVELYAAGVSRKEIAAELNRTPDAICTRLCELRRKK